MKVSMGCAWTVTSSGQRSVMRRMRRCALRFVSQAHKTIVTVNIKRKTKIRVFMALQVFDHLLQLGVFEVELCDLGR